jgi:hypothetical protein
LSFVGHTLSGTSISSGEDSEGGNIFCNETTQIMKFTQKFTLSCYEGNENFFKREKRFGISDKVAKSIRWVGSNIHLDSDLG